MPKFWDFFHKGDMKNSTQHHTYCMGCVAHYEQPVPEGGSEASKLMAKKAAHAAARLLATSVTGVKQSWIAHLLGGGGGIVECPYASSDAKAYARLQRMDIKGKKRPGAEPPAAAQPPQKKQATLVAYRHNEMPFGATEHAEIQAQALRAVVSAKIAFHALRDPEMLKLFGMLRTTAPDIIPSGKVLSGRLLNEEAENVELKIKKLMKNKHLGLSTDGWKSKTKDSVNAICANVDFKAYLLELVEVTALQKDGPSLCEQFAGMIDYADGGSKKGRTLLGRKRPWLILPSCWAHQFQLILGDYFKVNDMAAIVAEEATALIGWINNHGKVRKIFDDSQAVISADRAGKIIILVYLVANITRWTTHFVAFARLFALRQALQLAVLQKRSAIIAAEVGAAVSTERQRLEEEATSFCDKIEDATFWSGLENVLGDLEPICLGTNINQSDSTRPDQVLLTLAGIYLRFVDHPEPNVSAAMLKRLEKRWSDCDQPIFVLALILNPFEMLSCFGANAGLNHLKCSKLIISMYRRMKSRPDNADPPVMRKEKEHELQQAFLQYLSRTGDFSEFDAEEWEEIYKNTDPIMVWEALKGTKALSELARFAIILLHVVANQAGCERSFSKVKVEQTDHRNRLKLDKLDKQTKIGAQLLFEHQKVGLVKPRKPRNNHKSTANLLSVPRYRDLLGDQEDEDPSERGRALVSSPASWRTEMAKWIAEAREAEREERDEIAEETIQPSLPAGAWKPMTLAALFGEPEITDIPRRRRRGCPRVMEEEEALMQALAEQAEDDNLDDGVIEIGDDDEFVP
ncbi:ribonuclease H-like domain-containing protein [Mycena rebaudengoi]|nr:ribonuclease H-like domain-containing protein [Mycena rebaudengoi]